jgi:hypothetical protein
MKAKVYIYICKTLASSFFLRPTRNSSWIVVINISYLKSYFNNYFFLEVITFSKWKLFHGGNPTVEKPSRLARIQQNHKCALMGHRGGWTTLKYWRKKKLGGFGSWGWPNHPGAEPAFRLWGGQIEKK